MSVQVLGVLGAGGHATVVAELAELVGWEVRFFDDATFGNGGGNEVVGTLSDALEESGINGFAVAIGDNKIRQYWVTKLIARGLHLPVLIHPSACISKSASVLSGTVVFAQGVVQASATIGVGSIINTAATVDHGCVVAPFVHISPGAHIGGDVDIGERVWIGMGASVRNGTSISADIVVGAGAVVVSDLVRAGLYMGVPARSQSD